jgi:hypothetical protein
MAVRGDFCVRPRGISVAAYGEFHVAAVTPTCRSTTLRPAELGLNCVREPISCDLRQY